MRVELRQMVSQKERGSEREREMERERARQIVGRQGT